MSKSFLELTQLGMRFPTPQGEFIALKKRRYADPKRRVHFTDWSFRLRKIDRVELSRWSASADRWWCHCRW